MSCYIFSSLRGGGGGIVSDFYGPWVDRKKNVEESKQDINMSVLLPSIFFFYLN